MADAIKFLPKKKSDQLAYARQMDDVVSADGFDPTTIGMTAADVTALGTLLTADQANFDAINTANAAKKGKTQDRSGPGGSHDQLMSMVREFANAARVSKASDGVLATIGLLRRDPTPTRKNAPATAPQLALVDVVPGKINVNFREEGSAAPRARAKNSKGVLIAVVDGTKPETDGEAGTVPTVQLTRSPASLDSTGMPAQVRLYGCWVTDRGLTGPWSTPLEVTVV